jgi:hypothetical protein
MPYIECDTLNTPMLYYKIYSICSITVTCFNPTRRGHITEVKGTVVKTFIILINVEDISSLQTPCIAVTCVCCVFTEVFVRVSEPSLCFCVHIQMQTVSLQGVMQSVRANQYQYVGRHGIAFKFRLT